MGPLWILTIFAICICENQYSFTEAQAIPYSYTHGRDVKAVEARYKRFNDAKSRGNPSAEELIAICGQYDPDDKNAQCTTKVGRKKDSENEACDTICCMAGYKVGKCDTDYDISLNATVLFGLLNKFGFNLESLMKNAVQLSNSCSCTNDPIDVRCGPKPTFGIVSCPVDKSTCKRHCCRKGYSEGDCSGFLKLSCDCSNRF